MFTSILNNRLKTWAEEYHVYVEAQAGFRASMGTTDNIFVMHGVINHLLNKGEKHFCAFVDFTKAFDYVVREVIWYKLIKIGVRGKILNIIMSMYKHVKSKVKINNSISIGFDCNLGVRQGNVCRHFFLLCTFMTLKKNFI